MAPQLRPKPNTHARMQRVATKFNELEVTPSRPGDKSSHPAAKETDIPQSSQQNASGCSFGDSEDGNPVHDGDLHTVKPFSWSDAGSTANNTKRSSPADLGELFADDDWDFEESIAPFSSPTSEKNKLPDTMPLVNSKGADQSSTPEKQVDFSETASTARRSSPFGVSSGYKDIWNFDDSPPGRSPSHNISEDVPPSSPAHLPAEELYDSTPRKVVAPTQPAAELNADEPTASRDIQGRSAKAVPQTKVKKSRQRAKDPIRFDPYTQEIVTVSVSKKKPVATRLPIVRALQEAAKDSSSPVPVSQKPKPRPKRPRQHKKAKPEIQPAPNNPPPARGKDLAAFIGKSVQPLVETPSECLDDLANTVECDEPIRIHSASNGDFINEMQEPGQQRLCLPAAIDKRINNLNESRRAPVEENVAKRKRLSRQFSVSEKGSPVVINDTIHPENVESVPAKPHPPMTSRPEQPAEVQSSSFLRSESKDRHIEQQHGGAFRDIEGRSSSQWLRRVSDREPAPKHKSSMGKKLHDEIMKSFLGHDETAQEPSGGKPACTVVPNHAETQMRRVVDQLIARLDDKKAAVINVAETYRNRGYDSVAHLKQQCVQDSSNLETTFRRDSGLFGKKLQAATKTVEDHSSSREKAAVDLDNVMASRHRSYSQARLSLRAIRDAVTGDNSVMF
ncbi:uncharacterized protein TRIVIDRAFT_67302 [Trichoderma virens Gv29-8]|uniref:Uncharacterized protein n=1 Tax=Hypocrea virens (strain Gv29-8 / FGSC 10586) TaxID=413071 RepID=G9N5P8_HYPVG|nr:uncharacterized protein TRIVIDRAFT_67302 [Trichoderma virens Gv29-8]EHK18090.1 hypothetical protein TRIVIDRAFT_67302 [Trichoderma virens Gv29-8]